MRADRVRYDPRTGDVTAEGGVDARIGGRRVRAERVRYSARSERLEISNLLLEGGFVPTEGAAASIELAKARGGRRGGVAAAATNGMPASARLGGPWLEAELAEARDDLSRIRGAHRVRLGAGAIVIDGIAFDLDPSEGRLEVVAPVVKIREPRCTLVANRLLAVDPRGDSPEILLEGDVVARIALRMGPRKEEVRLEAMSEKLVIRREGRAVAFQLDGGARIAAPGQEVALEGPSLRGTLRRRSFRVAGSLEGRVVVVASAFAERRSPRRPWTILKARSFAVLPRRERPTWLAGPEARRPETLVIEDAEIESERGVEKVARLELYRPTWREPARG